MSAAVRPRNEKFPTMHHAAADGMLKALAWAEREMAGLEAQAAAALAKVQQEWAGKIKAAKDLRDALTVRIEDLEKERHREFFGETRSAPASCSVDLPHGTLLYEKTFYVVKPRKVNVLANLEKYGFEEAIHRDPVVDWDALNNPEEWPDEALAIIGTRRDVKETYGFIVKEEP